MFFSAYNIKFKKVDVERTFRPCFDDTNDDGKKDAIGYIYILIIFIVANRYRKVFYMDL